MITVHDLLQISVFAGLGESECRRLAEKAADIRAEVGEWVIREGEDPRFFVVLEGVLQTFKDIAGQLRALDQTRAGEFFGEIPILLGTPNIVSIQASSRCRLARFDRQQLQELIRYPICGARIFAKMTDRLSAVPRHVSETPSSRVVLSGSQNEPSYGEICRFLSASRVQFEWTDGQVRSGPVLEPIPNSSAGVAAIVDGNASFQSATVRQIAEALGFRTAPKQKKYDLIIVGAGPAGMAAAVYGASEGLSVLVVERSAAGGQAGTSSRIENYLGFPSGISGDELTERALKQAHHFGAEILLTRSVGALSTIDCGYRLTLDEGELIDTETVLLCTGVEWHRADIPGLDFMLGRGALYGASRHEAHNVAGKLVFVVGGGNSAGQAAVFFSAYAAEVIMLVRGKGLAHSMSRYLMNQIARKGNIRVESSTEVTGVEGEEKLERIVTTTRAMSGERESKMRIADALFLMIGANANTSWLPASLQRDAKGYICTGRDLKDWPFDAQPFPLETSLPGVFCAGDVRHGSIKRVASGVGEGSMSIAFIHEYLALKRGAVAG